MSDSRDLYVLVGEIFPELRDYGVVHHKILCHVRLFAEIVTHEIAHALRQGIEDASPLKQVFEIIRLRSSDSHIRRDSALAVHLAPVSVSFTSGACGGCGL